MNLLQRMAGRTEERQSMSGYLEMVYDSYMAGGVAYPITSYSSGGTEKAIPNGNAGLYQSNAVLFACLQTRASLFSEARFQFQQMRDGRPGDLFGTAALGILEHPWENGSTGDLLVRMEQKSSLAGNFYAVRQGEYLKPLNPDWVDIISGDNNDYQSSNELTSELIGYVYHPGGMGSGQGSVMIPPAEMCHYAPIPDPCSPHRGMSWLSPILRELSADSSATEHKAAFFRNSATPNMVIKFDPTVTEEKVRVFKDLMEEDHLGAWNAYKNLYIGGGADATVVGADFKQMDFKNVQGAGETRIAAAAGVPPVIVGLSEGLQAATYSNYAQARRRFADGTMRPLWRAAAGALETILPKMPNARLWYDDRDIPFLKEDQKDAADIQSVEAMTIRQLVDGGFKADTVVDAVLNSDFSRLEHTELFSVQLQAPITGENAPSTTPSDAQPAPPEGAVAP